MSWASAVATLRQMVISITLPKIRPLHSIADQNRACGTPALSSCCEAACPLTKTASRGYRSDGRVLKSVSQVSVTQVLLIWTRIIKTHLKIRVTSTRSSQKQCRCVAELFSDSGSHSHHPYHSLHFPHFPQSCLRSRA